MEAYVEWYDHDGKVLQTACLVVNPAVSMQAAHKTLTEAHPTRVWPSALFGNPPRYRIYMHEWFHLEDLV